MNRPQRTLLLNAANEPVCVINVRRALQLWLASKVEIVHEYDWPVQSGWQERGGTRVTTIVIKAPSVVRLLKWFWHRPKIRLNRMSVLARDGFTCQYCGKSYSTKNLNIDHVVPRSQGGRTTWENVVASCLRCNNVKGGRTPEQAGMKLRSKPARPAELQYITIQLPQLALRRGELPDSWTSYLYWTTPLEE